MEQIIGTPILNVNRYSDSYVTDNIGMSIGSRIREARRAAKLTQKALALKVGMAQGSLSELETGESQGTTLVASIAAALGVSALWLETGRGGMLGIDPTAPVNSGGSPFIEDTATDTDFMSVSVGPGAQTISIQVVQLKLRAGVTGYTEEPDMGECGRVQMPVDIIRDLKLNPEDLVGLRVKGRSMEPMMFEDDCVVINKRSTRPVSKEIFAVNWNGEAIVKMLLNRGPEWHLHSINPDFADMNVRSGQCSIVGHVVWQPGRVLTGRL